MVKIAAEAKTQGIAVRRRTRIRRAVMGGVAMTLSQIACPPVLAVVMMFLAARASEGEEAWRYAAGYVGLAIALPLVYLLYLVRRGLVSDLDVQKRHQRWRPLLAALVGMSVAMGMLAEVGAPPLMLALAAAMLIYTALAFTITLGWKISMHSAAAGALAMFCTRVFGPEALPLALGIPLMAWARIYLKRHTFAQTVAGATLGCVVVWLALTGVA